MNIEQLIKVASLLDNAQSENKESGTHWKIGENYFIRTVTMHLVGKLEYIDDKELVLSNAAWIADSGRFHVALQKGTFDEIECFVNSVIVNRTAIIDATKFDHDLPTESK